MTAPQVALDFDPGTPRTAASPHRLKSMCPYQVGSGPSPVTRAVGGADLPRWRGHPLGAVVGGPGPGSLGTVDFGLPHVGVVVAVAG